MDSETDTTAPARPIVLRSVLYMPAANQRALDKARSLPADGLIFDLEDAVAPDVKELAREQAARAVLDGGYGDRTVTIRANGITTPWGADDLEAAAAAAPDAIVVPKVEAPEELDAVAAIVDRRAAHEIPLWAMIETPLGILNAVSIGRHPRCSTFVVGTNDLARELRIEATGDRSNLVPHLAAIALAGRAAKVAIIDGVYNDIGDAEGLRRECAQGRDLGFDGKTLIHPSQIEPTNETWSPSARAVSAAKNLLISWEDQNGPNRGVATHEGRMIEALHVEMARRTIAFAEAIGQ